MRALFTAGLVLAAAASAHAQAPTDDELRQDTARLDRVELSAAATRFTWRLDAIAASTAAGTRDERTGDGALSVGAELAVSGELCDFLAAGGQLDLRTGARAMAVQQWASACLLSGAFTLVLDHRLVWDVEPRLLAPPRLRPDSNRQETVGLTSAVSTDLRDDLPRHRHHVELARFRVAPTVTWTPEAVDDFDLSIALDLAFIRYLRTPRDGTLPAELTIVGASVGVTTPAIVGEWRYAHTVELDVVRAEGWRWAGLRWGASLGVGDAVTQRSVDMTHELGSAMVGRAGASVERDLGPLVARLDAGRHLWPTYDGRAVIDDRVRASLAGDVGPWRGRLELAAARARLVAPDGLTTTDQGGVAVALSRALGDHATARAHVEVARSVYAPGASFAAPRWGAEALASIELHAGNR